VTATTTIRTRPLTALADWRRDSLARCVSSAVSRSMPEQYTGFRNTQGVDNQ
jgi:hypothetical protein